MNVVAIKQTSGSSSLQWWNDQRSVALVKRTAAKDCNIDEFDQFVAVCRDLGLSPLRKQIYAFVFNKADAERRNMALVVGIDGARSIAARSGNYRPDDQPPAWATDEKVRNALTNPHGIVSCTVGVYHRPTRSDPFERIVATVYWDEFAPIIRSADPDAYHWVETDQVHPPGHKRAGQPKSVKQLRPGASAQVTERLDPKKEAWTKMGRHKVALCAEMQALRRGFPEDMSRVYVEEETDKAASTIDGEFTDLTPSEMVVKADTDARLERLGPPSLFATFDDAGTLERVPFGQFADRMLAATETLEADAVKALVGRNKESLREFWGHSPGDALELRKILEQRSGAAGSDAGESTRAKAASPQHGDSDKGEAAQSFGAMTGQEAFKLKTSLITDIRKLTTIGDCLSWAKDARVHIDRLPEDMRVEVGTEFQLHQSHISGNK